MKLQTCLFRNEFALKGMCACGQWPQSKPAWLWTVYAEPHAPAVLSRLPKHEQTSLKAILLNCNDLPKPGLVICSILN